MGFNFIDSAFFSSISIRAFFSILTSFIVLTEVSCRICSFSSILYYIPKLLGGQPDFENGLRTGTTVAVITDSHSVCTNPEVSVRPMAKCGRSIAVRRGHKTQSQLDQFLSESMDQSPTPAVFRATLGINLLLWLCC